MLLVFFALERLIYTVCARSAPRPHACKPSARLRTSQNHVPTYGNWLLFDTAPSLLSGFCLKHTPFWSRICKCLGGGVDGCCGVSTYDAYLSSTCCGGGVLGCCGGSTYAYLSSTCFGGGELGGFGLSKHLRTCGDHPAGDDAMATLWTVIATQTGETKHHTSA